MKCYQSLIHNFIGLTIGKIFIKTNIFVCSMLIQESSVTDAGNKVIKQHTAKKKGEKLKFLRCLMLIATIVNKMAIMRVHVLKKRRISKRENSSK